MLSSLHAQFKPPGAPPSGPVIPLESNPPECGLQVAAPAPAAATTDEAHARPSSPCVLLALPSQRGGGAQHAGSDTVPSGVRVSLTKDSGDSRKRGGWSQTRGSEAGAVKKKKKAARAEKAWTSSVRFTLLIEWAVHCTACNSSTITLEWSPSLLYTVNLC
jgi:hypothetical protein